jgi:hypothetical protein
VEVEDGDGDTEIDEMQVFDGEDVLECVKLNVCDDVGVTDGV